MHSERKGVLSATVVIVTRNRPGEVLRAVQSAVEQQYEALEVLVYDDASEDGTAKAVAEAFPEVRVVRSNERVGYIVLRNRGFREAGGAIIFSIDDDAYFTSPDTVSRTMRLFEERAEAAAVALPYVEPRTDHRRCVNELTPGERLRSFVGCAHALRREVVNELRGYREFFVHQGEERDLAIRMREAGYEIVLGNTTPIVHDYSPRRDEGRLSYYGVRNTLLFDMLNVPLPELLLQFPADAFKLLRYKLSISSAVERAWYLFCSLGACVRYCGRRRPVRREVYRECRKLPRHGPIPVAGESGALETTREMVHAR